MGSKKSSVNKAIVAGAAGVAVGAAAGAAAMALSDKKNRKMVMKKAGEMKMQAGKTVTKTMDGMKKTSKTIMSKAKTIRANGKAGTPKKTGPAKKTSASTGTGAPHH